VDGPAVCCGRQSEGSFEASPKVALVCESGARRCLGRRHPRREQITRSLNAKLHLVRVRRHPNTAPEAAQEHESVRAAPLGELGKAHISVQVRAEVLAGVAHNIRRPWFMRDFAVNEFALDKDLDQLGHDLRLGFAAGSGVQAFHAGDELRQRAGVYPAHPLQAYILGQLAHGNIERDNAGPGRRRAPSAAWRAQEDRIRGHLQPFTVAEGDVRLAKLQQTPKVRSTRSGKWRRRGAASTTSTEPEAPAARQTRQSCSPTVEIVNSVLDSDLACGGNSSESDDEDEPCTRQVCTFPATVCCFPDGSCSRQPRSGDGGPTVMVTGSWLTVREQMPLTYARRLVSEGFAAFIFDFAGFGASQGEPRQFEMPARKAADLDAAARFLSTLADVVPNGVGLLCVCASAQYGLLAIANGAPIQAFATAAGWFHDTESVAPFYGGEAGVRRRLEAADRAAERFAVSGEVVMVPAYRAGDESAAMYFESDYYANPARGAVPTWRNEMAEMSWTHFLMFDGLQAAPKVKVPTLMVHSGESVLPDKCTARV
jgi:uncharacterized protein